MSAESAMKRILSPRAILRWLPFAVAVAFMLVGFSGMFRRAIDVFENPQEDMSFGWYVPVFSLYVLWTRRAALFEACRASRPSFAGFSLALPFLALALLGTRGLQLRLEQLGFAGLCVAMPWAFFGRRAAREFVFPALYLLFTVPMATFLDAVTIHLRLFASGAAIATLNGLGVDAVRQGTAIVAGGVHPFSIDVAEPCSGLRSLFALMATAAAYAWFTQRGIVRRLSLFLCSVPLAVLGNVTRILSICLVAAYASPDFAIGFYHDYSGYVVYVVALAALVAVGEVIGRFAPFRAAAAVEREPSQEPSPRWNALLLPVFASVFAFAFAFQAHTPASKIMSPPAAVLPDSLVGCKVDELRYCQSEQCAQAFLLSRLDSTNCPTCGAALDAVSLGENTILPADTVIARRWYGTDGGLAATSSLVFGGVSKSSIHRPELCLPAQGFQMSDPVDFEVGGRPFHALTVGRAQQPPSVLAYTFFNQDGFRTASHVRRIFRDVWDRSVHNRVDRWVMLTVNVSAPGSARGFTTASFADRASLETFLSKLTEALP